MYDTNATSVCQKFLFFSVESGIVGGVGVEGVEILSLWFYGEPDNAVEPFYVALEDNAGNRKDIQHSDPAASTTAEWQQWRIPLADFTDVDPTAIKIMYIGVGNVRTVFAGQAGL